MTDHDETRQRPYQRRGTDERVWAERLDSDFYIQEKLRDWRRPGAKGTGVPGDWLVMNKDRKKAACIPDPIFRQEYTPLPHDPEAPRAPRATEPRRPLELLP